MKYPMAKFLAALALAPMMASAQIDITYSGPLWTLDPNKPVVLDVEWTGGDIAPPDLAPYLRRDTAEVTAAGWSLEALSGGGLATRVDGEGITFQNAPGWLGGALYLLSRSGVQVSILSLPPPVGGIYNYSWPTGPSSRIATLVDITTSMDELIKIAPDEAAARIISAEYPTSIVFFPEN